MKLGIGALAVTVMLTPADFQKVEVFAGIEPGECQRLCRKVADISVKAGEYVCHEGDDRSLFGILEGRFEAVRLIDGAERVLGQRHPGRMFGEMSIAFVHQYLRDQAERSGPA